MGEREERDVRKDEEYFYKYKYIFIGKSTGVYSKSMRRGGELML